MLQRGGELDFPLEAVDVHTGGHFRRQEFDDDLAVEGLLFRQEHPTHTATAQLLVQAVRVTEGRLEAVEEVRHRCVR